MAGDKFAGVSGDYQRSDRARFAMFAGTSDLVEWISALPNFPAALTPLTAAVCLGG